MTKSIRNLLAEPYRLFFLTGAPYAVLSIGVWFSWFFLMERHISFLDWKQGPPQVHAHIMMYGVIGCYVFGFILTAFPRFVNQALPSPLTVLFLWGGFLLSQIFLMVGTLAAPRCLVPAGILEGAVYLLLFFILSRLYLREGKFKENYQPLFILFALFFGAAGSILFTLFAAFHFPIEYYRFSVEIGSSLFLLLLVVSITYRIVPFFTGRVIEGYVPRRGRFTLEFVLGLLLLNFLNLLFVKDLKAQNFLSWIFHFGLFLTLAREWSRWLPSKIMQAPMLIVLYLGLSWILVYLGFSGFELAYHLLHPEALPFALFPTPALHALFVGSFGTLLIGISTRVVRGHGGFPIVADPWMLIALLLIQTAALSRVFFPVLGLHWPSLAAKSYWAGVFWCGAFLIWSFRYIPLLFYTPTTERK